MSLAIVVRRNIQHHIICNLATSLSVAMGVMLITSLLLLRHNLKQNYVDTASAYPIVVGAPGSSLQLILNTIFNVGKSPGLIPLSIYEELKEKSSVKLAVPYAVGDSFRGFPVIATNTSFFEPLFPFPRAQEIEGKFAEGRAFHTSSAELAQVIHLLQEGDDGDDHAHHHEQHHSSDYEAVVGWDVAQKIGLKLGSKIQPSHGVESHKAHEHQKSWKIVGILKPTKTPVDRAIYISLASFYSIEDHGGALITVNNKQEVGVSALAIFPRGGVHKALLLTRLRTRADIQIADAATELRQLYSLFGNIHRLLSVIIFAVIGIAIFSIIAFTYQAVSSRTKDIAILRSLGAGKTWLMSTIVAETSLVSFVGAAVGVLLGHVLILVINPTLEVTSGFKASPFYFLWSEAGIILLITLSAAGASLWPAMQVYRVDVAKGLSTNV